MLYSVDKSTTPDIAADNAILLNVNSIRQKTITLVKLYWMYKFSSNLKRIDIKSDNRSSVFTEFVY